jgi:hypothetical protein
MFNANTLSAKTAYLIARDYARQHPGFSAVVQDSTGKSIAFVTYCHVGTMRMVPQYHQASMLKAAKSLRLRGQYGLAREMVGHARRIRTTGVVLQ